jgi:hydrogenase assembly chaperone HypC/HupF
MCLAAPALVVSVSGDDAVVDLDGVRIVVSRVLTPDLDAGDVALVHVGFVLSKIDPQAADEAMTALRRATQGALP